MSGKIIFDNGKHQCIMDFILIFKAMQLQANMTVIDATAGFGHDSLILASTGASVTLLEQQPLIQESLGRKNTPQTPYVIPPKIGNR
jgi:tRNA1(Val) A37 N6-methylase TrmN6